MPELGFILKIPFGKAVNPITKSNWEGVGVQPDIEIESKQAMEKAYLDAITKLSEEAKHPVKKFMLEWAKIGLSAKLNPYKPLNSDLKKYIGNYGPRKIFEEDGVLLYRREGRDALKMKPLEKHLFGLEGLDYFRLKFIENEKGEISEVIGLYDNGRTDSSMRD